MRPRAFEFSMALSENTVKRLAERGFVIGEKSNILVLDASACERAVAEVMAGLRPDLWEDYLADAKREISALRQGGFTLSRQS